MASRAAVSQTVFSTLHEILRNIASASFINDQLLKDLLVRAWDTAVSQALEDVVLSKAEEHAVVAFKDRFSLDILDKNGAYTRVATAAILRDILDGNIPQRVEIEGTLPFNFQKGKAFVWLFQYVPYYEPRTRTTYSGGI